MKFYVSDFLNFFFLIYQQFTAFFFRVPVCLGNLFPILVRLFSFFPLSCSSLFLLVTDHNLRPREPNSVDRVISGRKR